MFMNRSINIDKVYVIDDTIHYVIFDNTGFNLFPRRKAEVWVKYHNCEAFDFKLEKLPLSILSMPATLYLMHITWLYGVDLIVPAIDKVLNEDLQNIYETYSRIYGPFKPEWKGKIIAQLIEENKTPELTYDNIIFFSGGVDAIHAAINNCEDRNVLVTVPSIEWSPSMNKENTNFNKSKTRLIRDFSAIYGCKWLMVTNNFRDNLIPETRIPHDFYEILSVTSEAVRNDYCRGLKYVSNLLSSAPFAYAMGVKKIIMGSGYGEVENIPHINMDGANPELSDSFKFAGVSFAEQDGLKTRRSEKVRNIINWCIKKGVKTNIWACFDDSTEQCGVCHKCVRTQLNILAVSQNPKNWGFKNFDENKFTDFVKGYNYNDTCKAMLWDLFDSIDDSIVYPYCNELLHWLKKQGYKQYLQKAVRKKKILLNLKRIVSIHRYPHFIIEIFKKLMP